MKNISPRAGLTFNAAIVSKLLTNEMKLKNINYKLTNIHLVEITSTIEYLTAEILELAGNVTRDGKRMRITIEFMIKAIKNDDELNKVFNTEVQLVPDDTPKLHSSTHKILCQVHPDTAITGDASRFLDKLLCDFIKSIVNNFPTELEKVKVNEILAKLLGGLLLVHSINEGAKSIVKYNSP